MKKQSKVVSQNESQTKQTDQRLTSNFNSTLLARMSKLKVDKVIKKLDQIQDKICSDLSSQKSKNLFFINWLSSNSSYAPTIEQMAFLFADVESEVCQTFDFSVPKICLEDKILGLEKFVKAFEGKNEMDILLSPTSKRKLEKIEEKEKLKQSKSLLKKLQKDFKVVHEKYENWMENSILEGNLKADKNEQAKLKSSEQMRFTLKEKFSEKSKKSKSRKKNDKALEKSSKLFLSKFINEKPLFKKYQEIFEQKANKEIESILQQKHEWSLNNNWDKDKQREHELKISQMLKRRTILHNSLKNLRPIVQPTDPGLEHKRHTMEKVKSFGRAVKENFLPKIDHDLSEKIQKKIEELEGQNKMKTEVLENIEKNRGCGAKYLREAGRLEARSLGRTRNTLHSELDKKLNATNEKSFKPKVEIPHFKGKFDDLGIDEILEKIERKEINEQNYQQILNRFGHSEYPHVIKKLAQALKMNPGENTQLNFLLTSMKAKLKILDNLS